jgi:SAM-dependent methyltransferase
MTDARTRLVGEGYDAMADTWEAWKAQITDDPRVEWLDELLSRLPADARVVELGCGGGTPETAVLAKRYRLTGVDLSAEQLRRARERVPGADFLLADLTDVAFEPGSLDAVASFYALNHVPRELLAPLFARIQGWLVPGGLLLTVLGQSDQEGWTGDFLGAPTYFSSFPPEMNSRLLVDAGFTLLRDEVVTIEEPEGPARFQWVLAQV